MSRASGKIINTDQLGIEIANRARKPEEFTININEIRKLFYRYKQIFYELEDCDLLEFFDKDENIREMIKYCRES